MRTNLKIKPCPYCGSTATPHIHERYGIECDNIECGMGLACICDTLEEAIERWNRRDSIDKVVEQLKVEAWEFESFGYENAWVVDLSDAIEIVKKGGAV